MNTKILKEPRIIALALLVVLAIIALSPSYYVGEDGKAHIKTRLQFGLDIQGGVRALIYVEDQSDEAITKTISVLQTRLNAYGLKQVSIRPVVIEGNKYIQIEMSGYDEETLHELIESQGRFEARIPRIVELKDGSGTFLFDGKKYEVVVLNSTTGLIKVEGNGIDVSLTPNQTLVVENVTWIYENYTTNTVVLSAVVYTGTDIKHVFRDVDHARVAPEANGYRFVFAITTTPESAKRFAKVTKDMNEVFRGGECYLDQKLNLYMDNVLLDSLNIVCSLKGEELTMPSIRGWAKTKEEAIKNMKKLQSILESGALPSKIEIVRLDSISPALGEQFMRAALISMLLAIIGVGVIVLLRYRNVLIAGGITLTLLAELIIILGFAAAIGWNIDLASIAGILAIIGSGVDHQIIITDESIQDRKKRKVELSLKQRLKRALTIILTAAATLTAAMFPLLTMSGISLMKGFAVTTLAGVWIGVLFTRPAYSKLLEYIIK